MLTIIENLFNDLDENGIRYCNWKSNNKLDKSLNGEIDLELLCDRKQATEVQRILTKNNFKHFGDIVFADFPSITNYIGLDSKSGKLIHVHLHYELTFGSPYLKEYVSPWGSYVLKNRIRYSEHKIWITQPSVELFLLLIRYSMKIRRWNVFARRNHYKDFLEEYEWLKERADVSEIVSVAQELLSTEVGNQIMKMVNGKPTISQFHTLRSYVQSDLEVYNTHSSNSSKVLPLIRKGIRLPRKLNEIQFHRPMPTRRTAVTGGIEVAFIGVDGSGKSTHVSQISKWLSWKVDVYQVYFGSGDGPSSLLRFPLKKLNKIYQGRKQKNNSNSGKLTDAGLSKEDNNNSTNDDVSIGLAKALWALTLTREKWKKRRRARRARNKGMIVLMDRYPQSQIVGFNDGPLLQSWQKSQILFLRWLSQWEYSVYQRLHNTPPDLVVKLQTSPTTAKERKPETPMDNLEQKASAVSEINYKNTETVVIDTEEDLETVSLRIKQEIWKRI